MTRPLDISVVIPARDEIAALAPLIQGVGQALAGRAFEVIVVDDGSTDGTPHALGALQARHPWLFWARNDTAWGQSAAIRRGVRMARGAIVVTLDGDGQNPPDQIPALLAPFAAAGSDALGLVQGERVGRRDTALKRRASRAANAIRRALLRDGVRDSGCGLKAFRREAYLDLPWFDHIHRFMPAMMLREGWHVVSVPVTHRDRQGGVSKYGVVGRGLVGIPDLLGAAWLIRRAGPPRHPRAPGQTDQAATAAARPAPPTGDLHVSSESLPKA
ncbi:glycosyltransferase family 2 protein [Paracoccus endophyticus]|uniref:glycosyltransferase family 2 protein n=1 Tax=Paracoccus endophyticus TaxID=2233774 RepID=UPI000DDBD754|nr:glycosyltransferase family 2 protein [Paracoccus endophyticus]